MSVRRECVCVSAGESPAWEPAQTSPSSLVGESMNFVREPDAGKPPVRFDEREVETDHGRASEALANERAGNR